MEKIKLTEKEVEYLNDFVKMGKTDSKGKSKRKDYQNTG
ncbi:MAG: hypothetical protein AEth_00886 [Candidatus Argoarchaeum ethanivorans]|uniref:Uncharacterized protein n=1 Tax=Candidatus Argoarchaeum ethanivorans TaxID=2608793 RepID=A0A8B3S3F5_9EURY|nr:MAG: hypothetical protein AEth_00886 [Candidatus Argoarchaeum ethanivorans]